MPMSLVMAHIHVLTCGHSDDSFKVSQRDIKILFRILRLTFSEKAKIIMKTSTMQTFSWIGKRIIAFL